MTVAADTRTAVRKYPFLHTSLRAGIVNFTAAARFLDVGETDAVAAALRRYAEELDEYEPTERRVSVSMQSGITRTEGDDGLFTVGSTAFPADSGDLTAIVATGEIDAMGLESILGGLRTAEIDVVGAAGTEEYVAIVVDRRDGPDAVRIVEGAL